MGKPAAVLGSHHVCPKNKQSPSCRWSCRCRFSKRKISGIPAARHGDKLSCVGPPDTISSGSSSVKINGKPAARLGDSTAHGGKIVAGNSAILIGG